MYRLEQAIADIRPADPAAIQRAKAHWNSLAKPLGGLGLLEELVTRMAALGEKPPSLPLHPVLAVLCADNGVVSQGVSQCGSEVTAQVARALAEGTSTVCYMAKQAHCRVVPVDMGIVDFSPVPGVLSRPMGNGTGDITQGPAMSRSECVRAVETGIDLALDFAAKGHDLILTGEMGIGNTTTTAAVSCVLLDKSPAEVTGRGAGLDSAGLKRKIAAVKRAISVNHPNPDDPIDLLSKVGGYDLAGLCGLFLGGGLARVPVVIDGAISAAAALCASRLCPSARDAMLASHCSSEPCGTLLLQALGLCAPLTAGMHMGEGTGAVALVPLLEQALAVYHSGHTFDVLGIDAYTPQE